VWEWPCPTGRKRTGGEEGNDLVVLGVITDERSGEQSTVQGGAPDKEGGLLELTASYVAGGAH